MLTSSALHFMHSLCTVLWKFKYFISEAAKGNNMEWKQTNDKVEERFGSLITRRLLSARFTSTPGSNLLPRAASSTDFSLLIRALALLKRQRSAFCAELGMFQLVFAASTRCICQLFKNTNEEVKQNEQVLLQAKAHHRDCQARCANPSQFHSYWPRKCLPEIATASPVIIHRADS